jgi:hypothetical protein
MIHLLAWATAGYLVRDFLGRGQPGPPVEGAPPQLPPGPPGQAGARVGAQAQQAPQAPARRPPLNPSLPLDADIDEETERCVLAALEDTDEQNVLAFAGSLATPEYGTYYPIAAGVLRYHGAALTQARLQAQTRAAQQAEALRRAQAEEDARRAAAAAPPAPKARIRKNGVNGKAETIPALPEDAPATQGAE